MTGFYGWSSRPTSSKGCGDCRLESGRELVGCDQVELLQQRSLSTGSIICSLRACQPAEIECECPDARTNGKRENKARIKYYHSHLNPHHVLPTSMSAWHMSHSICDMWMPSVPRFKVTFAFTRCVICVLFSSLRAEFGIHLGEPKSECCQLKESRWICCRSRFNRFVGNVPSAGTTTRIYYLG